MANLIHAARRMMRSRLPHRVPETGWSNAASTNAVVTCHNYGRYLPQCLDSLLAQTVPFENIIVVNDASEDDTPDVCLEYAENGVRSMHADFRDVSLARNAGVDALPRSHNLLFVDADNWLEHNYHQALLSAFSDPRVGVAYAPMFHHGGHFDGRFSPFIANYDYDSLRRRNFADTCSLVRTVAWEQGTRWHHNDWGLQDWGLWLRVTRAGWTMKRVDETFLHYRVHPAMMSLAREGHYECGAQVMSEAMLTCAVTLFCGREWALPVYKRWLSSLKWRKENLHLLAIDNSGSAAFHKKLQSVLASTGIGYTLVVDDGRINQAAPSDFADSARMRMGESYAMNVHLARLYSRARQHIPARTDLVWCVEDDVEPPSDSLFNLCKTLFRHPKSGMVSGCLRSRFSTERLIAWVGQSGGPNDRHFVGTVPPETTRLIATGFFCTLFPRKTYEAIPFRPGSDGSAHPYYDWAACASVAQMGQDILLDPSVLCGHWGKDGTCLKP